MNIAFTRKKFIMNCKIESPLFEVEVNKIGAELSSIKSKRTGLEYIWEANPDVWGSSAPVLFPIIGMLKGGKYIHENTWYELPKHGFIRNNENLVVEEQQNNLVRFVLVSDELTKQRYPFDFQFRIQFSIQGSILTVSHQIKNAGDKPMYFSLGGHPAFRCPLSKDETYDDYELKFDKNETAHTLCVDLKNGLINNKTISMLDNSDKIKLTSHIFDNDALIFKDLNSKSISLNHKTRGKVLSVDFSEFTYLGIWAKPKANFVCIEPWIGIADNIHHNQQLKDKDGIIKLSAQQVFEASYSIEVFE